MFQRPYPPFQPTDRFPSQPLMLSAILQSTHQYTPKYKKEAQTAEQWKDENQKIGPHNSEDKLPLLSQIYYLQTLIQYIS